MQKPKWLRFPRIHLSTAVLVVLAAGAMLGVNLQQRATDHNAYESGWPITAYHSSHETLWHEISTREFLMHLGYIMTSRTSPPQATIMQRTRWWIYALTPLGTDVLATLGVILLITIINEFRVRRFAQTESPGQPATPAAIPQGDRT